MTNPASRLQQLGVQASSLAIAALEQIGADRATILLRMDGGKITYAIGGAKVAWDDAIVLGTISLKEPIE